MLVHCRRLCRSRAGFPIGAEVHRRRPGLDALSSDSEFLVAPRPVLDLLLCAKHLFVVAIAWQRCDLRRRCAVGGGHELTERKRPRPLELGGEPGRGLSLQSGSNIGLPSLCMWERCWRRRVPFLSATSSGRYRLVALPPCRGFVR
jgi:hypothetical protein